MQLDDVKIGVHPYNPSGTARINKNDFLKGRRIIELGCDKEFMENAFKNSRDLIKSSFLVYNGFEDYFEKEVEAILTHETIHLILSEMLGWEKESWDNVDSEHTLSRYGLS